MIYGIGIDVIQPHRVARLLDKYGERFVRRVLTPLEQPRYGRSPQPVLFLANRFAAKEAFSKAMGTGFRYPVTLQCISVVQNSAGKPGLSFNEALSELVRNRGISGHHLTISDESSLACACVVLET
ncbi:MAG: holo-ACP synthase [Betaproteobacteria bacterium]|jgi:holo-[acyl-carrier protein] synthase|nr:holo-ACP synthase [Betaproteobacteria bacterium]MDH4293439.1 holo-ACP synthase [Betaproteobacteria bacterium]MDH5343587.1 holo-ACP synthase [Betaproteobacteria bacterium]